MAEKVRATDVRAIHESPQQPQQYRCLSPVMHDRKYYGPGECVDLTMKQASRLGGLVENVTPPVPPSMRGESKGGVEQTGRAVQTKDQKTDGGNS